MLKKILLALVVALPLGAMAQKFVTVDLQALYSAMPETAAMDNQLKETSQQYENEYAKLQEEVNKLYADYQTIAKDNTVLDTIKERHIQEIQERGQKVEQFRNKAMQDLQQLQEQLMAPIQQKLNDAVKAVGVENGFTFIFPNDPMLVLYQGTDVVDATPLVKTKLGI